MRSQQDTNPIKANASNPPQGADKRPPRCLIEPLEETRFLFVDQFQKVRIDNGEKPAERAVFRKQHGVASAKLSISDSCPPDCRIGLWAGNTYQAWIRWSSDAPPSVADQKNNTLGFAIKLFGVEGRTLATDDPTASTADLIFQNSDIFFVDNAREMCAISADFDAFIADHKRSADILAEMAKEEKSLLAASYWSTHPYALGEKIVKYRLVPAAPVTASSASQSPNYLAEDLKLRLQQKAHAFLLQMQPFVDDSVTPIDRATARWDERLSPFLTIARIEIAAQEIDAAGQASYGESLAFSPWRTLHDNRPLGSIADARRVAYPSSAALRRSVNGQPIQEPKIPR